MPGVIVGNFGSKTKHDTPRTNWLWDHKPRKTFLGALSQLQMSSARGDLTPCSRRRSGEGHWQWRCFINGDTAVLETSYKQGAPGDYFIQRRIGSWERLPMKPDEPSVPGPRVGTRRVCGEALRRNPRMLTLGGGSRDCTRPCTRPWKTIAPFDPAQGNDLPIPLRI